MSATVTLHLPDEATLLPLTGGLRLGWVESPVPVQWAASSAVEDVAGNDAVLLASPLAYARLVATHVIVADIAVATEPRGLVALACERRPDELGEIAVDARDASPAAAALAGVLRVQHFGAGGLWQMTRTPPAGTPARLVEGDVALPLLLAAEDAATTAAKRDVAAERAGAASTVDEAAEADPAPPPGGVVEDLARAWFVLTGLPWVSHLLLAPRALAEPDLAGLVGALRESARLAREQEAAIVAEVAARLGTPTRPTRGILRLQRHALGEREQEALTTFYARATRYAGLPPVPTPAIVRVTAE
jgi:predicted solute-binding protein